MRLRRLLLGLALASLVLLPHRSRVTGRSVGVELGQVSTRGALPVQMARFTLAAALPRFEACWGQESGQPGGSLTLHLRVPASPVRHRRVPPTVAVQQRSVFDAQLETCVLGVARSLRFAPSQRDYHIWAQLNFHGFRQVPQPLRLAPRGQWIQVSGQVVNAADGRGLAGATVLVLQPWVTIDQLDRSRLSSQVAGMAVTTATGSFRLRVPRPHGFAYGLLVFSRGYESVGSDAAVRAQRPHLGRVRLERRRY